MLSSSNYSLEYSEFMGSAKFNVVDTLIFIGGTTGRTAFSNPYVYVLSLVFSKAGISSCFATVVCLLIRGFIRARFLLLFILDRVVILIYRCTELSSRRTQPESSFYLGSLSHHMDYQDLAYRQLQHH